MQRKGRHGTIGPMMLGEAFVSRAGRIVALGLLASSAACQLITGATSREFVDASAGASAAGTSNAGTAGAAGTGGVAAAGGGGGAAGQSGAGQAGAGQAGAGQGGGGQGGAAQGGAGQAGAAGQSGGAGSPVGGAAGASGAGGMAGAGAAGMSGKGGAPPVPTNGLVLWLKADDLSPGAAVSKWPDASPAKNDATQAAASAQPKVVLDQASNLPMVRLDGVDDFLGLPSGFEDFGAGATVIAVAQPTRPSVVAPFITLSNSNGNADALFLEVNGADLDVPGFLQFAPGVVEHGTTQLFSATLEPAGGVLTVNAGGTMVKTFANQVLPVKVVRKTNWIGFRDWFGSRYLASDLAEVLVFSRALSVTERAAVEAYLIDKWKVCPRGASQNDPLACGRCGAICPAGAQCVAGSCVASTPPSCDAWANGKDLFLSCATATTTLSARKLCILGFEGDLARIGDKTEQTALAALTPATDRAVGLTDQGVEGSYGWVSGAPLSYSNFDGIAPLDTAAQCGRSRASDGRWESIACDAPVTALVCEARDVIACGTPTVYGGHNYWLCERTANRPFVGGIKAQRAVCQSLGADLVKVDDAAENTYLASLPLGLTGARLGLLEAGDGKFVWPDQAMPAFTKWAASQPGAPNGSPRCVRIAANGDWTAEPCTASARVLCEK